jgi:hypothetical protein
MEQRGKNTNNTLSELYQIKANINSGKCSVDGYSDAVNDINSDIAQLEGQLTLEQAASNHITNYKKLGPPVYDTWEHSLNIAFKVGAEWQKEQNKEIINALKELVECDYTSGTHLSCALIRGKNALRAINEPFQD